MIDLYPTALIGYGEKNTEKIAPLNLTVLVGHSIYLSLTPMQKHRKAAEPLMFS